MGVAAGDAIGEIAQHHDWSTIDWGALESHSGALPYTDDTAMCIGVMESIIDRGRIEVEPLGARFHQNWAMEPDRGYGDGPPTVFFARETRGVTYRKASMPVNKALHGGAGSAGDGAAIRAQPIGLFMRHRFSLSAIARAARRSALVTHRNPIALDGAVAVALSVRFSVLTASHSEVDRQAYLNAVMRHFKTKEMRRGLYQAADYASSDIAPAAVALRLGNVSRSTASAQAMVPFAVYCFLREASTFVRCLEVACCSGGDADTIGAIACSICGARVGLTGIPKWLRTRLENFDYLLALVQGCRARLTGRSEFNSFAAWRRDIALRDDEGLEEL